MVYYNQKEGRKTDKTRKENKKMKEMTVGELINLLSTYDDDKIVFLSGKDANLVVGELYSYYEEIADGLFQEVEEIEDAEILM